MPGSVIAGASAKFKKPIIKRSLDWTEIRPLSPDRGQLAQQIECLSILDAAFAADEVPIMQTIYSPMAQAAQIAGCRQLLKDMRLRPDRLRTGLNALTESTLRFLEAIRAIPAISGRLHCHLPSQPRAYVRSRVQGYGHAIQSSDRGLYQTRLVAQCYPGKGFISDVGPFCGLARTDAQLGLFEQQERLATG